MSRLLRSRLLGIGRAASTRSESGGIRFVALALASLSLALATAAVIAQLSVQWWMDSIEPDPLGALFDLAWQVEAGLDGEGSLSVGLLDKLEQAAEAAEADDPAAQPRGPGQGLRSALAASLEVALPGRGSITSRSSVLSQVARLGQNPIPPL